MNFPVNHLSTYLPKVFLILFGNLLISSPLVFTEGLFIFISIFIEKKDFLSIVSKFTI